MTQVAWDEVWPLYGLRVRTPRLELRMPSDDDAPALLEVIRSGIHDPGTMPFSIPWTDLPWPEIGTKALQWWWKSRAAIEPGTWTLDLAVVVDGQIVGVQGLVATDFLALRTLETGSWLGRDHQGRGIGTEMRHAIVHLAFAGLGAQRVTSGAWHDNLASQRVSDKVGYARNGTDQRLRRGTADTMQRFLLTREQWRSRDDIEIIGLDPCRPLLLGQAEADGPT